MKSILQNKIFLIAIAISLAIHLMVLLVKVSPPTAIHIQPTNLPIKVVIGNAQQLIVPSQETVLQTQQLENDSALATVQGSESTGKTSGSSTTIENTPGTSKSRIYARSAQSGQSIATSDTRASAPVGSGNAQIDERSVVFKNSASRRSNATTSSGSVVITASTRDVGYSMYRKALRQRIERVGQINFPQKNGVRLYGELTVRIPLSYDGTVAEREGGPSVEQSSGSSSLDTAALAVIRRAAPFGRLPSAHGGAATPSVWIIITRLRFTRQ